MNKRHINRWGSATLILISAMALTGCAPERLEPFDVSTTEKARAVDCEDVEAVRDAVVAVDSSAAPGERAKLRSWGIDPDNDEMIVSAILALEGRVTECIELDDPSPSPAPATSQVLESTSSTTTTSVGTNLPTSPETSEPATTSKPTATATVTVTATATATATVTASTSFIRSWSEVIEGHPAVEELVNANEAELGWSWTDVQEWADLRIEGKDVDARLVIVTGEETLADDEARKLAGVSDDAVHVVQASACVIVGSGKDCPSGALVVYAPLVESEGTVKIDVGSGVVLDEKPYLVGFHR